jgi:trehalose-6-phosphatase
MDKSKIKIVAMDLDGTLTHHKEKLDQDHKNALDALSKKYKLIMVGAGKVDRIFNQMNGYPIDIIGNYGLQYATYNKDTKALDVKKDVTFPTNKEKTEEAVTYFRKKYGFTEFPYTEMYRNTDKKQSD